jgi:hypothetical protein
MVTATALFKKEHRSSGQQFLALTTVQLVVLLTFLPQHVPGKAFQGRVIHPLQNLPQEEG